MRITDPPSNIDLPQELATDLAHQNPWWSGDPALGLPAFRRWPFARLCARLAEPIAPIIAIWGPRQIGKTTLQQQIIQHLLSIGVAPSRVLRVQFDDLPSLRALHAQEPILRIVEWSERKVLGDTLNTVARRRAPAYLFFDEVQNRATWDVQLKSLVDHATVRVAVTGSSALRIGRGRRAAWEHEQSLGPTPIPAIEPPISVGSRFRSSGRA